MSKKTLIYLGIGVAVWWIFFRKPKTTWASTGGSPIGSAGGARDGSGPGCALAREGTAEGAGHDGTTKNAPRQEARGPGGAQEEGWLSDWYEGTSARLRAYEAGKARE